MNQDRIRAYNKAMCALITTPGRENFTQDQEVARLEELHLEELWDALTPEEQEAADYGIGEQYPEQKGKGVWEEKTEDGTRIVHLLDAQAVKKT